jgi:hypothetical protein
MNNWYLIYLNEKQRRQDEIKTAEAYRMLKSDPAAHPASRIHQRLVLALGTKMVQWGTRLQSRYEDLSATTLPDYASESPCG